ncbi:MAG: sensor histidine kinase [Hyphomicrobium sp.]|jgi:signal transduction histidine kinase|uniref:ATP-binding protein n=1 Tax=Hyphomicrobium sp. TaxID=82 RepID=UPI0025C0CADB|nr:sensor histidine kinase [Hyphomicrobium sp.]MBX9861581.1 sensor histidine kinase [Hyphomicrobium sp.]
MKFKSLAFRLLATSAGWVLLVLPIAGFIIYQLYRDDLQTAFDARLEKLVNSIAIDSMGSGGQPIAPKNRYEPLFEDPRSGWYWQIKPLDPTGGPPLRSVSLGDAAIDLPIERKVKADEDGARWMNAVGPAHEGIRMVEVIDGPDPLGKGPRYSVIVAGPIDWLDSRLANFMTRLSIALFLTGVGLVAVTLFQVRFGLLPLRRIEQGLAEVRSGRATKLEGALPAEIEPLQQELNALIESNQEIIDRARTQVGNLAHALKTPLAVITNEAREDKGPFGTKIAEQAAIMRDQVTHYLDRARVAAQVGVIGRATPVHEVLEPLARALERIHRERNISVSIECPPGVRFAGERQDLEEILGNVSDNACKWAKSRVSVKVTPGPARTGRARLSIFIDDDGPGLSADQRARIGKRGVRLDESKPGSGLGLSIVTDLVQSYLGSLQLARSPLGGLQVEITLPAA